MAASNNPYSALEFPRTRRLRLPINTERKGVFRKKSLVESLPRKCCWSFNTLATVLEITNAVKTRSHPMCQLNALYGDQMSPLAAFWVTPFLLASRRRSCYRLPLAMSLRATLEQAVKNAYRRSAYNFRPKIFLTGEASQPRTLTRVCLTRVATFFLVSHFCK